MNNRKKLIYVAGPYTATKQQLEYDIEWNIISRNILAAEYLSIKLFKLGWAVLTPHKNTSHYELYEDENLTYKTWVDADFEMLYRCDAIILLKNWLGSTGTKMELQFAKEHNIPCFYEEDGELPKPDQVDYRFKI